MIFTAVEEIYIILKSIQKKKVYTWTGWTHFTRFLPLHNFTFPSLNYRLRFHSVITGFNIREESSFGFGYVWCLFRETISNAVSFSFHFHWGGGGGWILMFMEFKGLAALGAAELCLSSVSFNQKIANANFSRPPRQNCQPLSWRSRFPKQRFSEPA